VICGAKQWRKLNQDIRVKKMHNFISSWSITVVCHAGLVHNSTYVLAKLAGRIDFYSSCAQHKIYLLVLQIYYERTRGGETKERKNNLILDLKKFKIKQNLIISRKDVLVCTFILLYYMNY
jgi:hypothetical protein